MDDAADLQAQIVALRLAVEGIWLSVLSADPNAVAQAERMRDANVASLDQLDAATPQARAARDAVALHTRSLWGSIVWQLQQTTGQG
jgi:hypothetical protein